MVYSSMLTIGIGIVMVDVAAVVVVSWESPM